MAHSDITDTPARYMVLADGETYTQVAGCKVVDVDPALEGDDVDEAIKARCRDGDEEAGAAVSILVTIIDDDTLELSGLGGGESRRVPITSTPPVRLPEIVLTAADVDDLADGLRINVLVGTGDQEIILDGRDFDHATIAALRAGGRRQVAGYFVLAEPPLAN
jgi:hypothetical protein